MVLGLTFKVLNGFDGNIRCSDSGCTSLTAHFPAWCSRQTESARGDDNTYRWCGGVVQSKRGDAVVGWIQVLLSSPCLVNHPWSSWRKQWTCISLLIGACNNTLPDSASWGISLPQRGLELQAGRWGSSFGFLSLLPTTPPCLKCRCWYQMLLASSGLSDLCRTWSIFPSCVCYSHTKSPKLGAAIPVNEGDGCLP